MTNGNKTTDLALQGAHVLAKLLGIVVPGGGTSLDIVIGTIQDRRTKRHLRRLQLLLEAIGRRVQDLEERQVDGENINLIDEIIATAVNDEDETKVEYYGALIEHVAEGHCSPYEVRLLGVTMRQLTIHDLQAFSYFSKRQCLPRDMPSDLEDSFWNRVQALGVFKGGSVKHPNNITKLGRVLIILIEKAG